MAILKQIHKIKVLRQEKAEQAVSRSRTALSRATKHHASMETRLNEHRAMAAEAERKQYEDLCKKVVKLADIEDLRIALQQLKLEEQRHEQALDAAVKAKQKAKSTLSEDTAQLQEAIKVCEKFTELSEIHNKKTKLEAEYKEEMELEEVATKSRDADMISHTH